MGEKGIKNMLQRKILIVEDNELNRALLGNILEENYEVLEAENGQIALDVLEDHRDDIALILLDINMPVMDGYTFLSRIQSDASFSSIPVIVTTQSDSVADEVEALSHGATDFVTKPYNSQVILHRVASQIKLRESSAMLSLAQYDQLTGLYTKTFFYQRVKEILVLHPDRPYDLLYSNIENFKLVNDISGIPAGDMLLCKIAQMLSERVNPWGICGRIDADHFACLLERRWEYSQALFQRAEAEIREVTNMKNVVIRWGVYAIDDRSISVEQMCDRALLAANRIKGRYGKYYAAYDEALRSKLLREQAITDSMEAALAGEQFVLYVQPKYRVRDESLSGAEALVRWNHPELGFLPPGEFIALFEKNGFITRLDQYVWEHTCAVLHDWDLRGYPQIPVSVNVSRADIYNIDLAAVLVKLVNQYELEPSRLHLEITESSYTENPRQIIDTVDEMRRLGFIIEMDDFGSGYSSLNMLNKVPLDVLKLDMKFFQNESDRSVNRGILLFIMQLARWMQVDVVAEGVETREQVELLREIGCDFVQGYYYAKPMPCEEFEALFHKSAALPASGESAGSGPSGGSNASDLEQEPLYGRYRELLLRHYHRGDPGVLLVGHYGTKNGRILDLIDHTGSGLRQRFGTDRNAFFQGLAAFVVDAAERRALLSLCLDMPIAADVPGRDAERSVRCFIHLPGEETGRYIQFTINWLEVPGDQDVTVIFNMTDITEQVMAEYIPRRLSIAGCDLVMDVDLFKGTYRVLNFGNSKKMEDTQLHEGSYEKQAAHILRTQVVPRDQERVANLTDPEYILERLGREDSYWFHYSMFGEQQEILTKNMSISSIDLRLGRVCMARSDITDSLREQQAMLNVLALTFDLVSFIDIKSGGMTMFTRRTVQENLSPYYFVDYRSTVESIASFYVDQEGVISAREQFRLETMLLRLREEPAGYDFVAPYQTDGKVLYKQVSVMWGDRNRKTVCLVRADVTDMLAQERRKKEELEAALALAEEASRAKSHFLSAMSHDIRTPLNAVIGMTELAFAHIGERERVVDCLQTISLSSRHLLSLINNVLDMAKIERSSLVFSRMKIALPELAEQVSSIIALQAQNSGIRFRTDVNHIRHKAIFGDPLRLNQILLNILGNAVKFTPKGGTVEFLIEELPACSAPGMARYRFVVQDTGIGMGAEFAEHIFEPFSRGGDFGRAEGSGLGLSITKGLVDLMGGEISVETREHMGSTFRVELEFEPADAGAGPEYGGSPENPGQERALSGRRFLVAEDNAINAEILCELLQMQGALSVVCSDGAQALRAFQDAAMGTYDAILMDIQMPNMNGYEAARAIRSLEREDAGNIPIIAMTANAFAEDVQAALEAGMTAHIAKPIDLGILLFELNRILR